jgi:ABC-type nitrate/sulfonate/bicarbonate transport system substrate-binding protein
LTGRVRGIVLMTGLALLLAQLPVQAARQDSAVPAVGSSFDTPAPTPRPTRPQRPPDTEKKPKKAVKKTRKTGRPDKPAAVETPPAAAITPLRSSLRVGMPADILGQAPLLLADEAGYFDEAGFDAVTLVPIEDAIADLQAGELDVAVVDVKAAEAAGLAGPPLRAVAGYRNYTGDDGAYGGDALAATSDLVANEPSTVSAFVRAYLRGLRQLDGAKRASKALDTIQDAGVPLDRDQREAWPDAVAAFAPFDGGLGSVRDEGGWGELGEYLTTADGIEPDLDSLVAQPTLNISQASLGSSLNPVGDLGGDPGVTKITVGLPAAAGGSDPISRASEAGYLEDAGFTEIEVMDVEQPLLGVLQGELDFAVIDAVDAADGAAQGLPLVALAGHRNQAADGTYGGDVLAVSADLLEQESSTVAAFLAAYVRALQDIGETGSDASYAPFDGGFGDRSQGGGLAQLDAYVSEALGTEIALEGLVAAGPLQAAQAWYGLPANPASLPSASAGDPDA